ncbi:MAG TPA: hypothetical protein VNE82_07720 [Candidatus Binataceae bacterium]|nr:hypothetical protein [Candidatus Binataceae bacterium]
MNKDQDSAVVSTRYGRFRITPWSMSHIDIDCGEGNSVMMEKRANRWTVQPCTARARPELAKAIIGAVEKWIAANPARFRELARRSLESEVCTNYLPEELVTNTLTQLRARVEVLKAGGGTIAGFDLSHYEYVLELATSTIAELKALDAADRRRAAA